MQPVLDFLQNLPGYPSIEFTELQIAEPGGKFTYGKEHKINNRFAFHLHIAGIFAEAAALAIGAGGPAAVATELHPVLNLVEIGFQVSEIGIQSCKVLVSCPEQLFLFLRQLIIRPVDGEIEHDSAAQKGLKPFPLQIFTVPWCNGALKNGEIGVGKNQLGINAEHIAEAIAGLAGTIGIVEGK
jgi:hypothetical protein